MSRRSFTPGMGTKEESRAEIAMRPQPPYAAKKAPRLDASVLRKFKLELRRATIGRQFYGRRRSAATEVCPAGEMSF